MASGVKCNSCVEENFTKIKINHDHQYLIFGLNDKNDKIVTLEKGDLGASYEDFKESLLNKYNATGCYAIFDYNNVLVFISWIPESINVKKRMVMASSQSEIADKMKGVKVKIQANSSDDIDEAIIKEKTASKV